MDIMGIIAGGLSIALGVTVVWGRVDRVLRALKELGEVLSAITKSFEDKKITPEEMLSIKKEVGEALAAFKAILK